jgi:hypothetical protein
MPFKKGHKLSKGRPKGSKNKLRNDLVQEILEIAEALKKEKKGLLNTAKEHPKWFFEHFVKALIPKNVEVDGMPQIIIQTDDIKIPKHSGRSENSINGIDSKKC